MSLFEDIINKKKKEWNAPGMMDGAKADRGQKIPFSSPLVNYSTYGGIPRDRITEFFGEPGSGKSTSCIDICKNAYQIFKQEYEEKLDELKIRVSKGDKQAAGDIEDLQEAGPKRIFYLDLEHSFDGAWRWCRSTCRDAMGKA